MNDLLCRSVAFDVATNAFCEFLTRQKRYSPRTVQYYRCDLLAIAASLKDLEVKDWSGVNPFIMRSVVSDQCNSGFAARTVARRLSSVRSLFNFLILQKDLGVNPVGEISLSLESNRPSTALKLEDVRNRLEFEADSLLIIRDRAIFELMYANGLRLSEVVMLNVDSIDIRHSRVTVSGSRSKMRVLQCAKHTNTALAQWLCRRQELLRSKIEETALFISQRGSRLSSRSMQQRLKNLALRAGIDRNVNPSVLRRSFASHLLESGGDLGAVQKILGTEVISKQLDLTVDYAHITAVYERAHPRAKNQSR